MKFHPLVPDHEGRRELSSFRYFGSKLINFCNIAHIEELTRNGKPYVRIYFLAADRVEGEFVFVDISDDEGMKDYEYWIHEQGLCRQCQRTDGTDSDQGGFSGIDPVAP
jgi:hypothetical protein